MLASQDNLSTPMTKPNLKFPTSPGSYAHLFPSIVRSMNVDYVGERKHTTQNMHLVPEDSLVGKVLPEQVREPEFNA